MRVRAMRKKKGLTQDQLAEKSSLSIQHIGEIERGQGNPKLDSLEKLSAGLEVPLSDLFKSENDKVGRDQVIKQILESIEKMPDDKLTAFYNMLNFFLEIE